MTRNQLCDLLLDLGPFGVKTNWEDADPKTERIIRNVGKGSSTQVRQGLEYQLAKIIGNISS